MSELSVSSVLPTSVIIQMLLAPNLRYYLPYMMMLLMLQGINPEIIFELIQYVTMSRQQHEAIMMAWTQLRLFASLLPEVKGIKRKSYRDQMNTFMRFLQNRVSIIFRNFQNSVLSRMLARYGFVGTIPSLDSLKDLAIKLAVVRSVPSNFFRIERLFFYQIRTLF